ncbi:MAG: anti-sigma factor [Terriglobales bacterium]
MTCEEFERVLPEIEGERSIEQESHLDSCLTCSDLIADLNAISQQARLLRDTNNNEDEPSPRVWNSIEIALRREGLIREPKSAPFLIHTSQKRRPRLAWLIPAAALMLLTFGVVRYQRAPAVTSQQASVLPDTPQIMESSSADDQQLLQVVSRRMPAMLASYRTDLRDVNSYIRDAKESVKLNPNDVQAQQGLVNAYQQKSMVYEMAMDGSLQ